MVINVNQAKGFTLVEMLVSIGIGAFIMAGMASVVLSSRTMFTDEQESAFIQENARYAVEQLSRDIRMAGSFGCAGEGISAFVNAVDDDLGGLIDVDAIIGYEGTSDTDRASFPSSISADADLAGDAVIVRYANPVNAISVTRHRHGSAETFQTGASDFGQGEILTVVDSNCRHVGIFQKTNADDDVDHGTSSALTPGNCTRVLKHTDSTVDPSLECSDCGINRCGSARRARYNEGSQIMQFITNAYYIGDSNVLPGLPALKKRSLSKAGAARTEELAQGVESFELFFGLDTNGDSVVDRFQEADDVTTGNNWGQVKSVRYTMIFRSRAFVFDEDDPATTDVDERYLRYPVNTTVVLRNR